MSQLFVLRALLFAGECFAASVLLLGIAAVVTRFLKAASLRHLVWLTAFGTMLVLPVAALVVTPQVRIHRPAEAQAVMADSAPFSSASGVPMLPPAPAFAWNMGAKQIALTLFAFWLIGFGAGALRLLVGAVGINALRMSSRRIGKEQRPGFADVDGCELRIADDHSGPMTWGTLLPVILLPTEAPGWPPERLRAVLLHEVAHVRRRDSLAQTLSRIACALYWPNPLAWVGAGAMRRDAEIAADDAVLGAGVQPSVYATELLHLAADYRGARSFAAAGLSMAAEPRLEARVKSILRASGPRKGVTHMDIAKIAGTGLLATAAFAFVRPSLAEDAPNVPAAPAVVAIPAAPVAPVAVAQNDLPPPPPTPEAQPTAPVPPTPPDMDYEIDMHGDPARSMRDMHAEVRHMTPEERRKLHRILHNLHHEIHDAMAKARPEMERAMAELRAHREELRALQPQLEQAVRETRPQIERAMEEARKAAADAKMDERVRRHIDEAMQRIEMHMDRHRNSNDGGDAMQRVTRDHDMHDMDGEGSGDQDNDQP